jgi:hypothetical protein
MFLRNVGKFQSYYTDSSQLLLQEPQLIQFFLGYKYKNQTGFTERQSVGGTVVIISRQIRLGVACQEGFDQRFSCMDV